MGGKMFRFRRSKKLVTGKKKCSVVSEWNLSQLCKEFHVTQHEHLFFFILKIHRVGLFSLTWSWTTECLHLHFKILKNTKRLPNVTISSARPNSKTHKCNNLRRRWWFILYSFPFQTFLLFGKIAVGGLFPRPAEQKKTIQVKDISVCKGRKATTLSTCQQAQFISLSMIRNDGQSLDD